MLMTIADTSSAIKALFGAQRNPENVTKAVSYLTHSSSSKNPLGYVLLGVCCEFGHGLSVDYEMAERYYLKGVDAKDKFAMYWLSKIRRDGLPGVLVNMADHHKLLQEVGCCRMPEVASWLLEAAIEGSHPVILFILAICHIWKAPFTDANLSIGINLLQRAAASGLAQAQVELGYSYEMGLMGTINLTEAFKWYCKSATHYNSDGLFNVGMCYLQGKGIQKHEKSAMTYFGRASTLGNAFAMNILGVMLMDETREYHNVPLAIRYLKRAAELGYSESQRILANIYLKMADCDSTQIPEWLSFGAEQTFKWASCSARQANAGGQYVFALCLQRGIGVTQDLNQAGFWCERAIEAGHPEAASLLESILAAIQKKRKST